jgi:putative Mg2+ transporter-C (MgtC) family protein
VELSLSEVALRLTAAAAAGALVGINRDLEDKPIGMRTLGLVALSAAIVSVAAIQVSGMAEHPDALSRVVQGILQGVMAGIGFIGAGVILRDSEAGTVRGLTTAATVWVAAALGIACGLGAWAVVVIGTIIAIVLLVLVKALERLVGR